MRKKSKGFGLCPNETSHKKKTTLGFNTNTKNNDEWITPPSIVHCLGNFDLDPCSPINRVFDTATHHYNKTDDGLSKEWFGRVWLNPPYGNSTFVWMNKLASHGQGIALIFARTDTSGFHREVFNKAHSIFFSLNEFISFM